MAQEVLSDQEVLSAAFEAYREHFESASGKRMTADHRISAYALGKLVEWVDAGKKGPHPCLFC